MKKTLLLFLLSLLGFQTIVFSQDKDLISRLKLHLDILASDSLEGRGLGTDGAILARNYIAGQFSESGLKPFGDSFFQDFRFRLSVAWISAVNVIGYIEGSDSVLKNEYIVIGAHYDHLGYTKKEGEKTIYPGADDNASGVASIIETGRYFAENPELLKRSLIVVAFDAEESGLNGSKYFVENSPVEIGDIKIMFSYDMVGMYSANEGLILKGMGSLLNGENLAIALAEKNGIILKNTSESIERRTDTAPFGNIGIPAVHVFTGTKSPYHKPEDKQDLLDFEGMATVSLYMKELLMILSQEEVLSPASSLLAEPRKLEATGSGRSGGLKMGVLINTGGGHHRYKDQFFKAKAAFNLNAGGFIQVPVNSILSLQQEVLYDFNGSQTDGGVFRRHSITLPLNIHIGTPKSMSEDVRFYYFLGGWYRYHFAGKSTSGNLDFNSIYSQDEWGYSTGFGVEIFRVTFGYVNRRAFTNIQKDENLVILDTNNYLMMGLRL